MSVPNAAFTRTNSFGSDGDRCYPRFYLDQVPDEIASQREGRPIFREEERVEIILPGNPQTRPVKQVTDELRQRWPEQYQAFKSGIEISTTGTPLEQWPRLRRAQVLELKALGFMNVEQIADMDDLACQRIGMGGMGLRNLAKAYLDDAEAGKLASQLQADNDRLSATVAEQNRKIEELSALLSQVHADLQGLKNAPNPIATAIPGMADPIERNKPVHLPPQSASASSLDMLGTTEPRRRGRPPKVA